MNVCPFLTGLLSVVLALLIENNVKQGLISDSFL
ncbi:MAG: hypothetical protein JWP78_1191 [Mucilaginibacter sp.]|nr:hypothetical protein [Mucilaginibacter sp.]